MLHLVIAGAGGFGLEVAAYIEDFTAVGHRNYGLKGFLDDGKPADSEHGGYPVLGRVDAYVPDEDEFCVIALGDPSQRASVADKLRQRGARFETIIHPSAYVAKSAEIGEGSIICPFAFVGPMARLGKNVVLNVHAVAGHESTVGDYSVLSPQAMAHGGAQLESGVFLGAAAIVTHGVHIGANARLSAGGVAYDHIPAQATALGNPARWRSM